MLATKTKQDKHLFSDHEKEKSSDHYVERTTGGARQPVNDAEATGCHEQDDTKHAETPQLMTREPDKPIKKLLHPMG